MKKVYGVFFLLIAAATAFAQTNKTQKKLFQKVTVGAIFGSFGSTTFTKQEKPFSVGYNLSANVAVVTPKTYHNVLYGMGNNSLRSLNGFFLPKNWDTYVMYSKILHTGGNYLGAGIEKMLIAQELKCFLFTELGTDFKGTKILSFGLLISAQNKIWKR